MMRRIGLFAVFLAGAALPAAAQALAWTDAGVVVAHDGRVALEGKWSVEGVANATGIVATIDRVAVLDALANEAVVVMLADGRTTRLRTAETPVDAAFVGSELYVLARDARVLQHGHVEIPLAPDPAFLREWNGKLYVYSRMSGLIQEIAGDRVTREVAMPAFASDLEIAGDIAYLPYPRDGRVRTVDIEKMEAGDDIRTGGVLLDLDLAGGTAITAPILAVADPASKRVWLSESSQTLGKAVARGFLRGLLGLGLFGDRSSSFPTGVDRVTIAPQRWIAYDSSTGTLYRFTKQKSSVIATGVPPQAFTLTPTGVAWWNGTSVAQSTF